MPADRQTVGLDAASARIAARRGGFMMASTRDGG
jgi:hypothetical protein